jgi:CMP-N-acetylneuraminic acid synthetase
VQQDNIEQEMECVWIAHYIQFLMKTKQVVFNLDALLDLELVSKVIVSCVQMAIKLQKTEEVALKLYVGLDNTRQEMELAWLAHSTRYLVRIEQLVLHQCVLIIIDTLNLVSASTVEMVIEYQMIEEVVS